MSVTDGGAERSDERTFTAKGLATRERIVGVAAALMYSGGVAGTGWEDVQKSAGVSASQLHHYFGDKEGLIRAVIAHQTRALLENQQPHLASLDSLDALRTWRDLLVEGRRQIQCQGGCPLGSLAGELFEAHPECREDLIDGFDQWESAIRDGLRAMHERGDLRRSADPDRLATALLAAVQGGLVLSQVRRDAEPLEVALDTVIEHIASLTTRRRSEPRRSESRP
jgi:TetR/AcrR family transcriptional regulator, transcriptional repressor for nem operon